MSGDGGHRVVIVGGGFGGLQAAEKLRGASAQVTLVDRRNFHLFQPLLYQVATGALSPGEIAAPLRGVLKRHRNATVVLGEVTDIDLAGAGWSHASRRGDRSHRPRVRHPGRRGGRAALLLRQRRVGAASRPASSRWRTPWSCGGAS